MKKLDTRKSGFEKEFSKILKQRAHFKIQVTKVVEKIFDSIEKKGAEGLLKFIYDLEGLSLKIKDLVVSKNEIDSAEKNLSKEQISAINLAKKRIEKFHSKQAPKSYRIKENQSWFEERWIPLRRVGLYVPAGKAPLASTALMTAIPAKLAGVKEMALASASGISGEIHPAILFAARLVGIDEIYKIGGAQAIAAFALGVGPIKKVDKIFGPGGPWASAAKVYAQSQGLVGIDTLAGPSEIVILSDGSVPIEFAIADLKAQLEHGQDGWAFLISTNSSDLEKAKAGLNLPGKNLILIKSRNRQEMLELANRIAPEHLEIHTRNPEQLLPRLFGPAAIYVGAYSPVAAGDYLAGPNHCLPTSGRAAFDSPLGVWDFMKRQSLVKLSQKLMKKIGKSASDFAQLEGLSFHSNSIKIRLEKY